MQQIGPANLLKLIKGMVDVALTRAECKGSPATWHEALRREVRFGWQNLSEEIDKVASLGDDLLLLVAQAMAAPDDYDLMEVISDLLADMAMTHSKGELTRIMPSDGEIVVIRFAVPAVEQDRRDLEWEMEMLASSVEGHAKKMGRRVFALCVPEQVEMTGGTEAGGRLQAAGYVRIKDVEAARRELYAKLAALEGENAELKEELDRLYKRLALHHAGLPLRPDEVSRPPQHLPRIVIDRPSTELQKNEMLLAAARAAMISPEEMMRLLGGKVVAREDGAG